MDLTPRSDLFRRWVSKLIGTRFMEKKRRREKSTMLMIRLTSLIGFTTAGQRIRFQFQILNSHDHEEKINNRGEILIIVMTAHVTTRG